MPFQWQIFLRILLAILRILAELPPEADHRPIANGLADAVDAQVNSSDQPT